MPSAYNLTRSDMHYRHDVFSAGLRAAGYAVHRQLPATAPAPGDLLLIWNRYGSFHEQATRWEKAGGLVIVAENGYIGRDAQGNQMYALARSGHNGSGTWRVGEEDRLPLLGLMLEPWQEAGRHIVVRAQRGIGSPTMASPPGWAGQMVAALRRRTKRPVVLAPHPGVGAERDMSHEQYLQGAHALVIWSSSVGVKALVLGVPVFYAAPYWIGTPAARAGIDRLEEPIRSDPARLEALQRIAWAQWSLAEIASGRPFQELVNGEGAK